jgi:hypothetical protein
MAKSKVDIFEEASRKKITFRTEVGVLNVSDLWDIPLVKPQGGKISLDDLALELYGKLNRGGDVVSFVADKAQTDPLIQLQFDLVKRVIDVKKDELAERESAAEKSRVKQQILEVLERKRIGAFETMSESALLKKLESL